MKIFEFDSPEAMKDDAVAKLVDGDGNPIEDVYPVEETEDQRKARIAQENVAALAESEQADDQKFDPPGHERRGIARELAWLPTGRQ